MTQPTRTHVNRHVTVLRYCLSLILLATYIEGQCHGKESFEKMTRVTLTGPTRTLLMSSRSPLFSTRDCLQRCRDSEKCLGVELDYEKKICMSLENNPKNSKIDINPVRKPINFFEKICINVPACSKEWILERVIGFQIEGYDDIVLNDIPTRLSCAELCLKEKGLSCKSAEFNEKTNQCRLSRQDRRSQSLNFRPASEHVHYIENQCNQVTDHNHCEFDEFVGNDIEQADDIQASLTKTECKTACEKERKFNCRSFTWIPSTKDCRLSSDDQISAGPSAVVQVLGAEYYQRAPCLDMSLVCTTDSMTLQLNTAEPFQGRVFAQNFPKTCLVKGQGRRGTKMKIRFSDANCGVVDEGDGVLSNIIVVQHHPLIQRRGDKAIKLLCLFQTENKTVSHGFSIDYTAFSGNVATAIVNATAPSPKIRLRIVDQSGDDVTGVRLGDQLYLRLDLDESSIYGILARNLVAKNGDNSDSIKLLDEKGCPVDPLIFPSLQPLSGTKSLEGRFEAFKFSQDTVVRFQLNVQFCLEKCKPARCGSISSYGRKRKRRDIVSENSTSNQNYYDEEADSIYHEMPLQREIIVANAHVTTLTHGGNNRDDIFELGDLVCTSKDILVAIIASCIILQICLILVAIMCVMVRKRNQNNASSSSSLLTLTMARNGRHRPAFSTNSENTLKSLRTTLRD